MDRKDATREINRQDPGAFLKRAKKRGYICPKCGNGSGKDGDGIRVTIENGKFICEVSDGGGDYGGTWFCDIELLRYHIERYKQGLKGERL